MNQSLFKITSALLCYPEPELLAALEDIRSALHASPTAASMVEPLLAQLEGGELIALQEGYVQTFDRSPAHSLHLFEHIHGEDRARGQAMVDLMEEYKSHGFEPVCAELPDYVPRKNKSNDYGFDPREQEHMTYTGMGADINVHDQWACESMGAIQDRTREHLGTSDKAISAYRRLLRTALDQSAKGERPLMVLDPAGAKSITGPACVDGIGPAADWQGYWRRTDDTRQRTKSWANGH